MVSVGGELDDVDMSRVSRIMWVAPSPSGRGSAEETMLPVGATRSRSRDAPRGVLEADGGRVWSRISRRSLPFGEAHDSGVGLQW